MGIMEWMSKKTLIVKLIGLVFLLTVTISFTFGQAIFMKLYAKEKAGM